jgi:hypothetical protein
MVAIVVVLENVLRFLDTVAHGLLVEKLPLLIAAVTILGKITEHVLILQRTATAEQIQQHVAVQTRNA